MLFSMNKHVWITKFLFFGGIICSYGNYRYQKPLSMSERLKMWEQETQKEEQNLKKRWESERLKRRWKTEQEFSKREQESRQKLLQKQQEREQESRQKLLQKYQEGEQKDLPVELEFERAYEELQRASQEMQELQEFDQEWKQKKQQELKQEEQRWEKDEQKERQELYRQQQRRKQEIQMLEQEQPASFYAYLFFLNYMNNPEWIQLYFGQDFHENYNDYEKFFTPIFNNAFLQIHSPLVRTYYYEILKNKYTGFDDNQTPQIRCIKKAIRNINNLQNHLPTGDENLFYFFSKLLDNHELIQHYFKQSDSSLIKMSDDQLVRSFTFAIDGTFQQIFSQYEANGKDPQSAVKNYFRQLVEKYRNYQIYGGSIILQALKNVRNMHSQKYKLTPSSISNEDKNKFLNELNINSYSQQDINKIDLSSSKKLGQGGFGQVFSAKIKSQEKGKGKDIILKYANNSATKQALKDELNNSKKLISSAKINISKPDYDEFYQANGNLLGYQQGLENISLTKKQFQIANGQLVSVQDQIKGKTVWDACFKDINCPANLQSSILQAAGFLLGILSIHEQGFVHRDIKPDNLMKEYHDNGSRSIKIIDLGSIDSITHPKFYGPNILYGSTLTFLPPEIAKAGRSYSEITHYTPQQEIYAVGLTLIPLLFGTVSGEIYLYTSNKPNQHDDTNLIKMFYYKPHEELQKFMRDNFSLINKKREEALEDPTLIGKVPQEVINQLGDLVADCLMMRPSCLFASDRNQDIGPYKDKYGRTLRRPTAEEALQILQNLALSDWEHGHYAIQK